VRCLLLKWEGCNLPGHTKDPKYKGRKFDSDDDMCDAAEEDTLTQILAALGGSLLTYYMDKPVPGWYYRPKVGAGDACA
jgi:hypothetical protein